MGYTDSSPQRLIVFHTPTATSTQICHGRRAGARPVQPAASTVLAMKGAPEPPAYSPEDPMSPAAPQQVPHASSIGRDLKQNIHLNTMDEKIPSLQHAMSKSPEPYGPVPAALMSSVLRFIGSNEWEKPPNWTPQQRDIGNSCNSCNSALRCQHGQAAAYEGALPTGHCIRCRSAPNLHQCQCGSYRDRGLAPSCLTRRRRCNGNLSPNEIIEKDLRAFNEAMIDVRAGECCSKSSAKRAVKKFKSDLIQIKTNHQGPKLSCHEKKGIKREAKAVADEFKREIRQAWRAAP